MSFWPFKRSIKVVPLSAEELQQQLVAIATTQSADHLRSFCKAYRDQIAIHAEALRTLPLAVREDERLANTFVQGLGMAAQCLQNDLGDGRLWNALVRNASENPITRWQSFIDDIDERMGRLEYHELIDELHPLLAEAESLKGQGARHSEAILRGRLGELLFHSGRVKDAREPMESALQLCTANADREGICIYLSNLIEVARYEGDQLRAVSLSEQLLEQLRTAGDVERVQPIERQLRLLRAGEPLCRIVCRYEGLLLELEEIPVDTDGRFDFEFVRNRPSLRMATTLTERAMAQASEGEFADAHEVLQRASEVDPLDPNPLYQDGMVLMEMGLYTAAREAFDHVEELAPGWFRCRSNRWLAEQLENAVWPDEVFRILRILDDGHLPATDAVQIAQQATEKYPKFAAFWLHLGDSLWQLKKIKAEAAYREGLTRAEEPDVESRLLCALAGILAPNSRERIDLVNKACRLKGSPIAQAFAHLLRGPNRENRQ